MRKGETMVDRYLFKAKSLENDKWENGYFVKNQGWEYIVKPLENGQFDFITVNPNTVCQCTGLKDKNGNLIWENDVIKHHFRDLYAQIRYGAYQSCFDSQKTEHIGFYVDWSESRNYRKDLGYWINMVNAEVVGNIFDNPELLESEE